MYIINLDGLKVNYSITICFSDYGSTRARLASPSVAPDNTKNLKPRVHSFRTRQGRLAM